MIQINLEKIIADKNQRLARRIPKLLFRLIKRVLHLNEMNEFLANHCNGTGADNVKSLLKWLNVTYTVHGLENIPSEKRLQFASNHPLGALDGIILLDVINTTVGEPRFLVNDLLLTIQVFSPLFVPVNAYGPTSKEMAKKIETAYASDKQILIFPSGMASRRIKGRVIDLVWKKSFIQKSIEYQRDIVPVFFNGKNSRLFYSIGNIRKFLGIKANIEMFLLPHEMFRKRNHHFHIYFGQSIDYKELCESKNILQCTNEIRKKVYSLST